MISITEEYFPVSIKEVTPGKNLPFKVYCHLKLNQKMVILRQNDEHFSAEALQELKAKEIYFLYVHNNDKEKYQDFLASDIAAIFSDKSLTDIERVQQVGIKTRDMLGKIQNVSSVEEAKAIMTSMNDFSQGIIRQCTSPQFSKSFRNLQKFLKEGSDLTVHSLNVSSLSVVFALALEKVELSFVESLAQAGLIHDLSLVDAGPDIIESYLNKPEEFSKLQATFPSDHNYLTHPQKLVQSIEGKGLSLPSAVKEIILQHHENFDGTGFPRHLKGPAIHLGAKILRICNDYELAFRAHTKNGKVYELKTILGKMEEKQKEIKAYDPRILAALVRIVEDSPVSQGGEAA